MTRSGKIEVGHNTIYSMKGSPFSYSPLVQEDMLHLSQLSVYKDASETFTRFTKVEIDACQYQRVVQFYGEELSDVVDVIPQAVAESAVHYTMVDGSMVLTDEGWKEVKVGRHFSSDNICKAGSESRHKIKDSMYQAQMTDSELFKTNMDYLIEQVVPKNGIHVFLNDGAVWIENWIKDRYPNAISILDFFHGGEYICDGIKAITADGGKHKELMSACKAMLYDGKVLEVITLLEDKAKEAGKNIDGILQYLRHNAYRMEYDKYRNMGLMIGSGAIEAAHRTVVQSRMKLSGQRWTKSGVHAMLKLRSRYESNRWDDVKNKVLHVNFKNIPKAA